MDLAPPLAGMPLPTLTEVARLRLESLSFFLLLIVLSTAGVRWVWNDLAKTFPRMPRLGFRQAFGLVALWGAAFVLILTMISGARELLTPGAWEKRGWTYALADGAEEADAEEFLATQRAERERRLRRLHYRLVAWAAKHDGAFPDAPTAADLGGELWELPGRGGAECLYREVPSIEYGALPLVVEPEVYDDPLTVRVDGEIVAAVYEERPTTEAGSAVPEEGP